MGTEACLLRAPSGFRYSRLHIVLHNEIHSAAFDVTTCQSNSPNMVWLADGSPGMAGGNVTVSHISCGVVHFVVQNIMQATVSLESKP